MADRLQKTYTIKKLWLRPDRVISGPLFERHFHSFLQYSIPGSASGVCLLWSTEWESEGASLLPLIRALCKFPLLEESKFKQWEKKKKKPSVVVSNSLVHCDFKDTIR